MISVKEVSKSFNDEKVLDNINLEIVEGEILVILGQSGAGKSVLLKHLIGLLKPDSGSIKIDSQEITNIKEKKLLKIRAQMGYLFQEGALYDFLNVFDNIAFPLREHTKLKHGEIENKVKHVLSLIDLEGVEEKFPAELSGGMKKRVALARAIILDSKILFCDEPTSGLDPIRSKDISDLIRSVSKKFGTTTIITSHDIANTFRIADRVVIIQDNRIAAIGTPDEIKNSKNEYVQTFIN